jgi:serine/threonine-protein kinase
MGVLWIAEHSALRCRVVVKFLSDELAANPSAIRRFAREAAAVARVRSPHVVQILDHGFAHGMPFIVMEELEGSDLRTVLRARGPLSLEETAIVVRHVARALAKTHAAGIVHRDVKPSNIFLTSDGADLLVKLLDFGLAHDQTLADGSSANPRPCVGTPPYMSPEQITGQVVDARSDVWSLGVVAFECCTGRRPFDGETHGAVALAVHSLRRPRLTEHRPGLSPALDSWFSRACALSVDQRFASAVDASEALTSALEGGSWPPVAAVESVPPPGATTPDIGWHGRQTSLSGIVSTVSAPGLGMVQPLACLDELVAAEIGAGCVVVWRAPVTRTLFDIQRAALHRVAGKHAERVAFLCVIGAESWPPPSDEVRRASAQMVASLEDRLAYAACVVEGDWFRVATARTVLGGMRLLVPTRVMSGTFADVRSAAAEIARYVASISPERFASSVEILRSLPGRPAGRALEVS